MGIHILHPYFTVSFILLLLLSYRSFLNFRAYHRDKLVWFIIVFLIILSGFRNLMIDDYAYLNMYNEFSSLPFSYESIKGNSLGMEWLYVLLGKIFASVGLPFVAFIVISSIFTISLKYRFFEHNSAYPILSWAMYMIPSYLITDMAHIRQGIAITIVFISFYAIKERKLLLYFFLIYLAYGFHNSAIIFLPAYFLVLIPLNRWVILVLVAVCMAASPFAVYEFLPLESLSTSEVMEGFNNYANENFEDPNTIKFFDLISLFYLYFIFTYNQEACEKIPYYEYMRNLTVIGICVYFIFRINPIFSTRLVTYYFLFGTITIPCIIASIRNNFLRKNMYHLVVAYIIFYFFVFSAMQGKRAYSPTTYSNWLIGG